MKAKRQVRPKKVAKKSKKDATKESTKSKKVAKKESTKLKNLKKLKTSQVKPAPVSAPEKVITVKSLRGKLEKELLQEQSYLQRRLASIQITASEAGGDFGDMSSAISDEDMKMLERDRLLKKLETVERVLSRVQNNPKFAHCDDCEEEIDARRLLLIPTARRCVYCQQMAEK